MEAQPHSSWTGAANVVNLGFPPVAVSSRCARDRFSAATQEEHSWLSVSGLDDDLNGQRSGLPPLATLSPMEASPCRAMVASNGIGSSTTTTVVAPPSVQGIRRV